MKKRFAALVWMAAGAALAQPVATVERLTTREGFTLYVFDNDVAGSGKSVCQAACSNIFPPYLVEPGAAPAGDAGVVTRDDGARQWAWKGRPLYRFYIDAKPGDAGGDGLNRNTWHVAKP